MNLKFAIIPWAKQFYKDKMFSLDDKKINRDNLMVPFFEMKQEFERRGDQLHTIDIYNFEEIDFFLFFVIDWKIVQKVIKAGKANCMIYCNAEPPVVDKRNTPEGYRKLKRIFPYILTWNDDWLDNETIFKRNLPHYFTDERIGNLPFEKKSLITCISGNKSSSHPDELYSERERAISYFEEKYPDQIEFYGVGWDKRKHKCYGGKVDNKANIYHQFKFAICYENMKNIKGYVTEKIFDCLTSGIVPIYKGASDICKYVPKECFISLEDFESYDDLAEYLIHMRKEEYEEYLKSADHFLKSEQSAEFSGATYAGYIYDSISGNKEFRVSVLDKMRIQWKILDNELIALLAKVKRAIFKF